MNNEFVGSINGRIISYRAIRIMVSSAILCGTIFICLMTSMCLILPIPNLPMLLLDETLFIITVLLLSYNITQLIKDAQRTNKYMKRILKNVYDMTVDDNTVVYTGKPIRLMTKSGNTINGIFDIDLNNNNKPSLKIIDDDNIQRNVEPIIEYKLSEDDYYQKFFNNSSYHDNRRNDNDVIKKEDDDNKELEIDRILRSSK